MTLRMKPPGFQFGPSGCAAPLLLVQRTMSVLAALGGGATCASHWRKPYLPSSRPSGGWLPGLAAVDRKLDHRHAGIAAEGDAADGRPRAGFTVSPRRIW